jgi:hypothetical protein
MATTTGIGRNRARRAADQQAKERRQKLLVGLLGGVLLIVLVFQLPKVFKSSGTSAPPPAATTPSVPVSPETTPPASATSPALRAALAKAPHDVFAAKSVGSETTLGNVPTPAGLHDPFASPSSVAAKVAPAPKAPPVRAPVLPGTIVLGTPGAGRVAERGWIVILASIPTAAGQVAANSFAGQAQKRSIGKVSVLNSSNRRPLRGGYWVVYTGPYPSLGQVTSAAGRVHGAGFGTAYVRELIVYRKKSKK